jgi:hypothetical protein
MCGLARSTAAVYHTRLVIDVILRLAIPGLTGLLICAPAFAQGVRLAWSAPARCPGAGEVSNAIERRLGRSLATVDPPLAVDAAVSAAPGGYELVLRTSGGERAVGARRL